MVQDIQNQLFAPPYTKYSQIIVIHLHAYNFKTNLMKDFYLFFHPRRWMIHLRAYNFKTKFDEGFFFPPMVVDVAYNFFKIHL